MKNSEFQEIRIDKVELDRKNPRIAKFLEMYDEKELTGEAISLALGGGTTDDSQTSYSSLYESIKTSKGIIHPIIVNHEKNGKYTVIEGNTRVQIYKDLKENNAEGNWDTIPSIVYENLEDNRIHAIRLQSHLVGPREWDPYSKAKYLNYLSNIENLPMNQLVSFCGGKSSEINKLIRAFQDMEKYYRPILSDDDEFDQRDFSKFVELQNYSVKEAIISSKYSIEDFAKWVVKGNVDSAINVRKLPSILKNTQATETFIKTNIKDAYEKVIIDKPEYNDLKNVAMNTLCTELSGKINNLAVRDLDALKDENNEVRTSLYDLKENIDWLLSYIEEK
jgi:hypothetical protein